MIPRIIELKNFLSYGETIEKIDFSNHDLICLSGKNGNGKSALLDALTWAIWGQARKITGATKADEGLLRLGQTRMMVSAEFEFGAQIYRVRREYAKTYGKPFTALDFELFDPEKNAFSSLTDKTVRTTQAKIEKLLGIDYETFINTSFLKQGQAHEFSKKNPKERKQILATILGLAQYDTLQQKALEYHKKLLDEKKQITTLIEQQKKELEQEPQFIDQRNNLQNTLQELLNKIEQLAQSILEQEKAQAIVQTLAATHQHILQEHQELTTRTAQEHAALSALRADWRRIHSALLKLPCLKTLDQEITLLQHEEKALIIQQKKLLDIQKESIELQGTIQQRTNTLKQDLEKQLYQKKIHLEKITLHIQQNELQLTQKQTMLHDIAKKHAVLSQEKETLEKAIAQSLPLTHIYEQQKQQFDKRRATYQVFIQKGNWLKNALGEAEQKKTVVHDLHNPACPLCEQMLTVKRKQFLSHKLVTHEHFLHHQLNRVSQVIKTLKPMLVDQHKHLESIEQKLTQMRSHQEHLCTIQNTLLELTPSCDALVHEITLLQDSIAQQKTSQETLCEELQRSEKNGSEIIKNDPELATYQQRHQALIQEQKAFSNLGQQQERLSLAIQKKITQKESYTHLTQEQEQQAVRKNQIINTITQLKALKTHISTTTKRLKDLQEQVNLAPEYAKILIELRQRQKALLQEKDLLMHQCSKLSTDLERLESIKKTMITHQVSIRELEQEIDDYHILAQTFGKNGIQALLIEESIPEIEREANMLLSRLTDNHAQIFIESLRDLKSGGTKESLDIHISDAAGIRPYEMYSGGEAFRVDFALRIAISKLLARRAGTALQTLIIDEGFGSQDDEGIARITEALYAIRKDFSKIIIVSHLTEMKDSFPVHFFVEKLPTGSVVKVYERG